MGILKGRKILVGVTGGIAAYKAAALVRLLRKEDAEVRVVMTPAARNFITPLTLATLSQNPVFTEGFDPSNGQWNSHVSLGTWADLMVVAPATANTLAKMAHGIADNLLLTTYLSARCPVLVAPAMDADMYAHPATQQNLQLLGTYGVRMVAPDKGFLASGLEGKGRMAEPEKVVAEIKAALALQKPEYYHIKSQEEREAEGEFYTLETIPGIFPPGGEEEELRRRLPMLGRRVLVTLGPTHEPIDPVRFIGNQSSGRMGTAIVEAFSARGAEVYCVCGPAEVLPKERPSVHLYRVTTALEMEAACKRIWPSVQFGIMAAAVADYRVAHPATEKIKRDGSLLSLELVPNPDIAAELGAHKGPYQLLVGFALETSEGVEEATRKVKEKQLDLCVLNTLCDEGAGFGYSTNRIALVTSEGIVEQRELETKREAAEAIVDWVCAAREALMPF